MSRKGSKSETTGCIELLVNRFREDREGEPHESSDAALEKKAEDACWDLEAGARKLAKDTLLLADRVSRILEVKLE